jgi:hypothetical protein
MWRTRARALLSPLHLDDDEEEEEEEEEKEEKRRRGGGGGGGFMRSARVGMHAGRGSHLL